MKFLLVESKEEQIKLLNEISLLSDAIANQPLGTPVRLSREIVDLLKEVAVVVKS